MHPEIEKTLKRIAGGEIKTACVYSLIDTYYMCIVRDIDAELFLSKASLLRCFFYCSLSFSVV